MYPATVDEWAEPLEADDAGAAVIRPLLAGTNLREARLRQQPPRLPMTRCVRILHSLGRLLVLDEAWNVGLVHSYVYSGLTEPTPCLPRNLRRSSARQLLLVAPSSPARHAERGALLLRVCRLAYDADRDGWSAEAFHGAVDTFGAAVRWSQPYSWSSDSKRAW